MKAIVIASFLVAALVVSAHAQLTLPQNENSPIKLNSTASDTKTETMSRQQLISITKSSVRENIATSLEKVADELKDKVAGASDVLEHGGTVSFASTVEAKGNITEQHSVNVRVSYEARPIGGILNIRVELVPVFGGIGSASRPVISREFAEAVDNFDDDAVGETIGRLTRELAAEFAAK